jgi:hypothetical protein
MPLQEEKKRVEQERIETVKKRACSQASDMGMGDSVDATDE